MTIHVVAAGLRGAAAWALTGIAFTAMTLGLSVGWAMHALPYAPEAGWVAGATVVSALLSVLTLGCAIVRMPRKGWWLALCAPVVLVLLAPVALATAYTLARWEASHLMRRSMAPTWVAVSDGVLHLHGVIHADTVAAVDRRLAETAVRRVVITSEGGDLAAARALLRRFESAAVEVLAAGVCESACAILWASSHRRAAMAGTRFLFHAARPMPRKWTDALPIGNAESYNRRLYEDLRRAGIPENYRRAINDPSVAGVVVSAEQLAAEGVSFRLITGPTRDTPASSARR